MCKRRRKLCDDFFPRFQREGEASEELRDELIPEGAFEEFGQLTRKADEMERGRERKGRERSLLTVRREELEGG